MQTNERSVRPFYIMALDREIDLANIVKELKKKLKDKSITAKEIKLIDDMNKALDNYKKTGKK